MTRLVSRGMFPALIGAVLAAASGAAVAEVSGNVAFTSDYRFRGISQTGEDFAVQGGFDYAHASGLYAGTWASVVDNFNGANSELDVYAGFGGSLTDALSWDVNVLYFYYPGATTAGGVAEINFLEVTPGVALDLDNLSASLSASFSSDYYGESGDSTYYNLGVDVPLGEFGLGLHAGYQTVDDNVAWGTPDYADWSVSLSKSLGGLDWSLSYVDTDLEGAECFGGPDDVCAATAILTVGKSL